MLPDLIAERFRCFLITLQRRTKSFVVRYLLIDLLLEGGGFTLLLLGLRLQSVYHSRVNPYYRFQRGLNLLLFLYLPHQSLSKLVTLLQLSAELAGLVGLLLLNSIYKPTVTARLLG